MLDKTSFKGFFLIPVNLWRLPLRQVLGELTQGRPSEWWQPASNGFCRMPQRVGTFDEHVFTIHNDQVKKHLNLVTRHRLWFGSRASSEPTVSICSEIHAEGKCSRQASLLGASHYNLLTFLTSPKTECACWGKCFLVCAIYTLYCAFVYMCEMLLSARAPAGAS